MVKGFHHRMNSFECFVIDASIVIVRNLKALVEDHCEHMKFDRELVGSVGEGFFHGIIGLGKGHRTLSYGL